MRALGHFRRLVRGCDIEGFEEQEGRAGKGAMATPKRFGMDMGTGGQDDGALPRAFSGSSSRLRGRNLR